MAKVLISKTTAAALSKPTICNDAAGGQLPVPGSVFVPGTIYCTGMAAEDDPITVHLASPEDPLDEAGTPLAIGGTEITLTSTQNNYKVASVLVLKVNKPATAGQVGVYFSQQGDP